MPPKRPVESTALASASESEQVRAMVMVEKMSTSPEDQQDLMEMLGLTQIPGLIAWRKKNGLAGTGFSQTVPLIREELSPLRYNNR